MQIPNEDKAGMQNGLYGSQALTDCHAHLGHWQSRYLSVEKLALALSQLQAEYALVSSLSAIDTLQGRPGGATPLRQDQANRELVSLCRLDERLLPLAVCQPGREQAAGIEKLLSEEPIHGLKFHPYHLDLPADDPAYEPFMALAAEAGLPCVFHAAPGTSHPERIYRLARRFPTVPVVLYHLNLTGDPEEGLAVLRESRSKRDANLYMDTSWVPAKIVARACNAISCERVLFGSDVPLDGAAHYSWYRQQFAYYNTISPADRYAVLNGNSRRLFRIPHSGHPAGEAAGKDSM